MPNGTAKPAVKPAPKAQAGKSKTKDTADERKKKQLEEEAEAGPPLTHMFNRIQQA